LIARVNVPLEALVLASVVQSLVDLAVRVILLACGFIILSHSPHPAIVLVVPLLIPLFLLTLGVALISALLNAVLRDVGQAINLWLTFLMFASPVLYEIDSRHVWASRVNPIAAFLEMAQDLSTVGYLASPTTYLAASSGSVLLFLVAWRLFVAASLRIAERI
jgi:ABC-type polysaccharide/polyol phosphate export permease